MLGVGIPPSAECPPKRPYGPAVATTANGFRPADVVIGGAGSLERASQNLARVIDTPTPVFVLDVRDAYSGHRDHRFLSDRDHDETRTVITIKPEC